MATEIITTALPEEKKLFEGLMLTRSSMNGYITIVSIYEDVATVQITKIIELVTDPYAYKETLHSWIEKRSVYTLTRSYIQNDYRQYVKTVRNTSKHIAEERVFKKPRSRKGEARKPSAIM